MENNTPQLHVPSRTLLTRLSIAIGVVCVLGVLLGPTLLWAYNLQRAGNQMAQGLVWPELRRSDSLPSVANNAALDDALARLAAAKRWRPQHAYAYRLAGQIYLARADWVRAASELERARALASDEPLIAWEASLAYEQMQQVLDAAPGVPMLDTIAAGQLAAPGQLVRSQFCNETGAASCYLGRVRYELPQATDSDGARVARDAIFLHPPASLSATVAVSAETPVLRVAIGLDPVAHEWNSDGGSFRVLARDEAGETEVAAVTIDAATARAGWVTMYADVYPWAGKTITLRIESGPGPAGDPTDDWFAWGDLSFISRDAAAYAPLKPLDRMISAWQAAGQIPYLFLQQRDQALAAGRADSAAVWERRAELLSRFS